MWKFWKVVLNDDVVELMIIGWYRHDEGGKEKTRALNHILWPFKQIKYCTKVFDSELVYPNTSAKLLLDYAV